MIAIVVGGVGINAASSALALERLPPEVSLALAPYGEGLPGWAAQAREGGHELLLQIPLEPFDFPASDPGEHTLLADDSVAQNTDRLDWLMSRFQTYAGVISYAGGRFLGEDEAMGAMIDVLAERGLMFFDEGSATRSRSHIVAIGQLPYAAADLVLDSDVTAAAIEAKLGQLEALATQRGYAIGSASAFPVTIDQIARWAEAAAERGVTLVPVTALVNDPVSDATRIVIE